ncbi:MAG: UvrD-helicase domain-containing protein [Bacteroidia bacterium]
MNFTVYKSSAGSGKTFTLVREYLKMALSDEAHPPQRYRNILAITFTNKAAAEMKERIIKALKELSDPALQKQSKLGEKLLEDLNIQPLLLAERASALLRAILHNYTDFAIGTIDSFTHRIVRSFSHDLHLPANFEIETDSEKLIREAVDVLISRIGTEEGLSNLLLQFAETKSDDQKSWQIENELRDYAKHLLEEEGMRNADKLRHLTIDDFLKINAKLRNANRTFEEQLKATAGQYNNIILKSGLPESAFYQSSRGIYSWFAKIEAGDFSVAAEPNSYVTDSVQNGKWAGGKADASQKQQVEAMADVLTEGYHKTASLVEEHYGKYVLRKRIISNIYALSVLNELEKIIFEFRSEENILHISEFNKIISRIVFSEPVPFIYERLGEKYTNYLIDEFQDTSIMQWQNLLPLVENSLASGHFTMLVGDGKQSIYRWRGGEVEQFANLPKVTGFDDHPLVKEREQSLIRNYNEQQLNSNYRSKREIIEFNNAFFRSLVPLLSENDQSIYHGLEQNFNPENTGGLVSIEFLENADKNEELYINHTLALIQELKAEGWSYNDMVVLCMKNTEGSAIAEQLIRNKIPVLSSESLLIANAPQVIFMSALLRLIDFPDDLHAAAVVFRFLHEKGHLPDLHNALRQSSAGTAIEEILLRQGFNFNPAQCSLMSITERAEHLVRIFHLDQQSDAYITFFLDEIISYSNSRSSEKIDFHSWWEDRSSKASVIVPEGLDAVTIMTIHKSKGLEFPVVIFPFADWGIHKSHKDLWIEPNDEIIPELPVALVGMSKELEHTAAAEIYEREYGKALLDALNVLYVAMTRPEHRIYITSSFKPDKKPDKKKKDTPGTIADILKYALEQMNMVPEENKLVIGNKVAPVSHSKTSVNSITSALPSTHSWQDKVRIRRSAGDFWDEEKIIAVNKGKLLHRILSEIEYEHDIAQVLNGAVQKGWIAAEDQKLFHETIENIIRHPELNHYFNKPFRIRNEAAIVLPGSGSVRPDRVMEHDSHAVILDYKTGKNREKDQSQLNQYAEQLHKMGYSRIERILVYTETMEIIKW